MLIKHWSVRILPHCMVGEKQGRCSAISVWLQYALHARKLEKVALITSQHPLIPPLRKVSVKAKQFPYEIILHVAERIFAPRKNSICHGTDGKPVELVWVTLLLWYFPNCVLCIFLSETWTLVTRYSFLAVAYNCFCLHTQLEFKLLSRALCEICSGTRPSFWNTGSD